MSSNGRRINVNSDEGVKYLRHALDNDPLIDRVGIADGGMSFNYTDDGQCGDEILWVSGAKRDRVEEIISMLKNEFNFSLVKGKKYNGGYRR